MLKFPGPDADPLTIEQTVGRITKLNRGIAKFWSNSHGWAPASAAGLLGKSRLDWQVSLSETLAIWTSEPGKPSTPGELILAWTNLGTLLEGTLKLLLSVWLEPFSADIENLKAAKAFDHQKDQPKSPNGLMLESLKIFCNKNHLLDIDQVAFVDLVQARRNAIHAFKDRPIGDHEEFRQAVRGYLEFLRKVNLRLPYPDHQYEPSET